MTIAIRPADLKTESPLGRDQSAAVLASDPAPSGPSPRRSRIRRLLIGAAAITVLAVAVYGGWEYWTVWRFEQSTDDAYVQADVVAIAPRVSGYLTSVQVNDNQAVKAGDVLATIDPRDYQATVDQAAADVAEAQATIANVNAQLSEQRALIEEARATIDVDQSAEVYAEQNAKRFGELAQSGYGSVQNAQQTASQIASAKALVAKDKAALVAAERQTDTLNAQLLQAQASLAHNQAVLDQARLNLGYTILRAPVDGVIGMRMLRVGLYAQPGTQLVAVVPLQATYVVANYKETQLADVKPGQPVAIDVDTFSGTTVRGIVDSLAPASGQEFALLPPDNATGNFTKIVQRIPVKITIDRTDPLAGRLRPGMSVTTTIRTGPPLAAGAPAQ